MFIIKLGGSVITDKTGYKKLNKDVINSLIGQLKGFGNDLVVVHGAGSYGHILAKKGHIGSGTVSEYTYVSRISADMIELNLYIQKVMRKYGMLPFSIPPHAFVIQNKGMVKTFNTSLIKFTLNRGMVPLLYGDVVADTIWNYSIISGDEIIVRLAKALNPDMIIFVSDVDGVFDKNHRVIANIKDVAPDKLYHDREKPDVTGGILKKVESMKTISSFNIPVVLLNGLKKNRLRDVLSGSKILGTYA